MVVVLSARSLENRGQLNAIVMGQKHFDTGMVPVNCPGLVFPSAQYYSKVFPRVWVQGPGDVSLAESEENMKAFFKRICAPFSMHASDDVISAQAQEVLSRIPAKSVSTMKKECEAVIWTYVKFVSGGLDAGPAKNAPGCEVEDTCV